MSQHATDVLIRDLVQTGRDAMVEEAEEIAFRISTASFPTVAGHLVRRIIERQWSPGTTEHQYIDDIRRAALDERTHMAIYARRGGHVAALLARTGHVLQISQTGEKSLPLFFVAYSADRGIILSAYQASSLSTIALPRDVRWLT